MIKSARKIGIKMEKPYFIVINDYSPQTWLREIDREITKGGRP
jgi:hypothetical protein